MKIGWLTMKRVVLVAALLVPHTAFSGGNLPQCAVKCYKRCSDAPNGPCYKQCMRDCIRVPYRPENKDTLNQSENVRRLLELGSHNQKQEGFDTYLCG